MHRLVTRTLKLIMVGCFIASVCDVNWMIIIAVFSTAFLGLLTAGLMQGVANNQQYEAAVLPYREPDDPIDRLPLFHPVRSLLFLAAFAILSGTAIQLDSPWIAFVPLLLLIVFGAVTVFRRQHRRHQLWEQFAKRNGLEFDGGNRWDPRETPTVSGTWAGCQLCLGTAWQSSPHSRSSTEVFIGTADTIETDDHFCVDQLEVEQSTSDLVARLFERQDLSHRLRAARPHRIALFEGQVSLHAPHVPRTAVELRFNAELLKDLSQEIADIVSSEEPGGSHSG